MATPIISRKILVWDYDSYPSSPSLPRLGQILSQGAISGALGAFILVLAKAISIFNSSYLVLALPFYMGWGAFHGLIVGLIVWTYTRVLKHRFGAIARIAIAGISLYGLSLALSLLLPKYASSPPEYLSTFGILTTVIVVGMVGSLTGSTRRLGRGFSHGLWHVKARQRLLLTIAGSALRIVVFFGFLDSVLFLVCVAQPDYLDSHGVRSAIIGFLYFLFASVIVFSNQKLWLTTILILLLNSPLFFALVKLQNDPSYVWHFIIAYLSLWAAFLVTQLRVLYSALSVIKEELRYYLID